MKSVGVLGAVDNGGKVIIPSVEERATELRAFTIDLSVARTEAPLVLNLSGNWLYCRQATPSTAQATIQFNTQRGDGIPFGLGFLVKGLPFTRLYLTNSAQAGATLTLFYSDDSRMEIINPSAEIQQVGVVKADTVVHGAQTVGVAAVSVIAANPLRQRVTLQADDGNAGIIWVGGSGVTVANSIGFLQAGDSITLQNTTQIYAISDTAAQDLRYYEESES